MTDHVKNKSDWFTDKEYRDMDWLGKVVEPYVFPLVDELNKVPETTKIVFEDILALTNNMHNKSLPLSEIIEYLLCNKWSNLIDRAILKDSHFPLSELFGITFTHDLQINLETQTMNGTIICQKKSITTDDEAIKEMAAKLIVNMISCHFPTSNNAEHARANEIIDLLDSTHPARKCRSVYRKRDAIRSAFHDIIMEDKWHVRNIGILQKAAIWTCDYVRYGNLAAIANLTKLKCMTHKHEPIYSMEEIV